jgi:hypothetical protein
MSVQTVTRFVLDDFPLTAREKEQLMYDAEERRQLDKWFCTGLGDWSEAAQAAVDIWRREATRR